MVVPSHALPCGHAADQASRSDINTLEDLAEAIVEVVDYSSLGGFQMQWRAMDAIDLNPFIFPPQLRFAGIHDSVVFDILDGSVDVGAVRTYVPAWGGHQL